MTIKVTNCGDCIFRQEFDHRVVYCGFLINTDTSDYIVDSQTQLPNCPLKQGEITVKLEENGNK